MGRRPKVVADDTLETTAPATEAAETDETGATVRRRRRRTKPNPSDSLALLNALLAARGARGASSADITTVVSWGRGIYAEANDLKSLSARVRKSRNDNTLERLAALELNQALLAGVHSGQYVIDVDAQGNILFANAS